MLPFPTSVFSSKSHIYRADSLGDMQDPASTVDQYLAELAEPPRSTLGEIRRMIQQTAPAAVEQISYGMPSFKQQGMLIGFAAHKTHWSLHPMRALLPGEFEGFDTAKGTVRFRLDEIPDPALVIALVERRIAENEAAAREKKQQR